MFTIIWGTKRRPASRSGKNGHRRTHPSSPFERLEPRRVLSAAFDLVGLTALRADPLFTEIDGQLPWGEKVGVAVLDTGVMSLHPDLQSNFVAGFDAVRGGATFLAPAANDRRGHGTHVAGTAVSSNPEYGVATEAGLIDVRVLLGPGEPQPSYNPLLRGLQWVIDNRDAYNIQVVNMSVGYGGNFATPDGSPSFAITAAIDNLERLGVTVVAASGNDYARFGRPGAAFPANVSTLSVGNVWAHEEVFVGPKFSDDVNGIATAIEFVARPDLLAAASQRSLSFNQILAPGSQILSTSSRGDTEENSGTSMASPLVAGAAALLQDAAVTFGGRWLAADEVRAILMETADPVFDADNQANAAWWYPPFGPELPLPETQQWYRRINIQAAVEAVFERFAADDANAVIDTATPVPPLVGTREYSVDASIGFDGGLAIGERDVDLYRLTLELPGMIGVDTAPGSLGGSFDAFLRLFDESGHEIARADDSTTAYPRLESVQLASGTYYVGVSSFDNSRYSILDGSGRRDGESSGGYRLTIGLSNTDPNGTIPGAVTLAELASMQEAFGNANSPSYYWEGDIYTDPAPDGNGRSEVGGYDVDMFEFVAPDDGNLRVDIVSSVLGDGSANAWAFDTLIRVFDASGQELAWAGADDAWIDSFIVVPLVAHQRVFVGVSDVASDFYDPLNPFRAPNQTFGGTYRGLLRFDNGDADGTLYNASTMPVGIRRYGQIGRDSTTDVGSDGSRDVDMYFMPQQASGLLEITVTGSGDFIPQVRLYAGNPATGEVWLWDETEAAELTRQVYVNPALDYMVSVTGAGNAGYTWFDATQGTGGATGNYQITARYGVEDAWWDLNDDWLGSPAITRLPLDVWRYDALWNDGDLFRGETDVDLFRFTASEDNTIDFVTSVKGTYAADTVLRVFDANGVEIALNDDIDDTSRASGVRLDVIAGETYYVGISGWNPDDLRPYDPAQQLSEIPGSVGDYWVMAAEVLTPVESDGAVWLQVNRHGRFYAMREKITVDREPLVGDVLDRWPVIAADSSETGNYLTLQGRGETRYHWPAADDWKMLELFSTLRMAGQPVLMLSDRVSGGGDAATSGNASGGGKADDGSQSDGGLSGYASSSISTDESMTTAMLAWAAIASQEGVSKESLFYGVDESRS